MALRRHSGIAVLAGLAIGVVSAAPAAAETTAFSYTGEEQRFVVPAGVSALSVTATGAGGDDVGSIQGGRAAVVSATIPVTPGQELFVEVGGSVLKGSFGFGGGAGGGGGASDVRTFSIGPPNGKLSLGSRLLVAGGGGGAGFSAGATGGDAGQAGGAAPLSLACAGRGGTQLAGGLGGQGGAGNGEAGKLGVGGSPAGTFTGGGGGGLYGGGGAAATVAEPFVLPCAGGGGGSSLVPEGGSLALALGSRTPPGVSITYSLPPGPPAPDRTAPRLSQLTIAPSAFKAASSGAAASAVGGAVFYRLSEPARVDFRVERAAKGRRQGKRCLAGLDRGRRCVRFVKLRGSFADEGGLGLNRLSFKGRLRGRALKVGRYRLVAIATDPAGNSSKPLARSFRISRSAG